MQGDYRHMTGEGIPFRKLGFDSLGAFLTSLPETLIVRRLPTGGMMVALTGTGQQRSNNQGQVIFKRMPTYMDCNYSLFRPQEI